MNSGSNVHSIEQLIRAEQIWSDLLGTGYESIIVDPDLYEELFA